MGDGSHGRMIGDRALAAETLVPGYGHDPSLSEGSVKPPVFLTSTFVLRSAEEGHDHFDVVAGCEPVPAGGAGLVYSRFNHPNSEIVEERLAIYEAGEAALMFGSGMAAITTAILATARPDDMVLHSQLLYGGTGSLACHPASTTHSGVPAELRARIGVTDALIRLSIGLEDEDDLVADLTQALAVLD